MRQKESGLHRYAVWLEYDGAAFSGFQLQKKEETVQSVMERAVKIRFGESRRVAAVSRTDAGVHALGQVAVVDMRYQISARKLMGALNSALPPTVRVVKAACVAGDWDARGLAIEKTYAYLIYNRPIPSPLRQGRVWQVVQRLDLASMRTAAGSLLGKHDFSSFRAMGCMAKHPVREIRDIRIHRKGDMVTMRFVGNSFLYHMVRNLVGTLVEVGKGRIKPDAVRRILRAKDRKQAGPTAPACGLYLEKIKFKK